jgi:hypothetical protein
VIWIVAAIALGLLTVPPRFRKIGFAVLAVVLLVFLATVIVNRRSAPDPRASAPVQQNAAPAGSRRFDFDAYERDKRDKEDPGARTRVTPAQVRFDQVGAGAGADAGTIQSIRARLYNDSPTFAVTDYSYYLRIQDCLADVPCTTVYDQRGWLSQTVPAGQARDVVISIPKNPTSFAAPFKLLGKARIELTPDEVRAYSVAGSPP